MKIWNEESYDESKCALWICNGYSELKDTYHRSEKWWSKARFARYIISTETLWRMVTHQLLINRQQVGNYCQEPVATQWNVMHWLPTSWWQTNELSEKIAKELNFFWQTDLVAVGLTINLNRFETLQTFSPL